MEYRFDPFNMMHRVVFMYQMKGLWASFRESSDGRKFMFHM